MRVGRNVGVHAQRDPRFLPGARCALSQRQSSDSLSTLKSMIPALSAASSPQQSCPRQRRQLFSRPVGPPAAPVPVHRLRPHRSRIPSRPAGAESPGWNSLLRNSKRCAGLCGRRARSSHALADRGGRINVQRGAVTLRQSLQRDLFALQCGTHRRAAEKSLSHFAIGKGRRTPFARFGAAGSLALGGSPFTLMATTVSSSKASSPRHARQPP